MDSVEYWVLAFGIFVWAVRVAVLLGKILNSLDVIKEAIEDAAARMRRLEERQENHERRIMLLERLCPVSQEPN